MKIYIFLSLSLATAITGCHQTKSPISATKSALKTVTLDQLSLGLSWDSNSPEDGVAGYRVFRGTESRDYSLTTDVGNVTDTRIEGISLGVPTYLSVTAYTAEGLESDFSDEVKIPGVKIIRSGIEGDQYTITFDRAPFQGVTYSILSTGNLNAPIVWTDRGGVVTQTTQFPDGIERVTLSIPTLGLGAQAYFKLSAQAGSLLVKNVRKRRRF